MGFSLCVRQDVSMYRYSWGSSLATLDLLASSLCRPLHPVQGSSVGFQKYQSDYHYRAVTYVAVSLTPSAFIEPTGLWALLASLCLGVSNLYKIPLSTSITFFVFIKFLTNLTYFYLHQHMLWQMYFTTLACVRLYK